MCMGEGKEGGVSRERHYRIRNNQETGGSVPRSPTNGTLLTRVVDTPGTGIEPGLAFEAAADGSVTP